MYSPGYLHLHIRFCSAVEFSSLFYLLLKKKEKKCHFKIFLINRTAYSPAYFDNHISFLWCFGVFLFSFLKKEFHLRLLFLFFIINHMLYPPTYFHLHLSLLWCSGDFLFVILAKRSSKKKKKKSFYLAFFSLSLSHFFFS